MLPYGLTEEALAVAAGEPDPEALPALARLRSRFGAELAAAAVTQVVLRRRAADKFGAAAAEMFFTRDGLEQATRPGVAAHRAQRFRSAGVTRVLDLGCGIGADARALAAAGLEVIAVERDLATAEVAKANLALYLQAQVVVGEAAEVAAELASDSATAVFCDPSRRTGRGRTWRVEDFSPGWPEVVGLLDGTRPACVKLGPGLPYAMIPPEVQAEWVSDRGDVVEVALWRLPGQAPGRSATLLPAGVSRTVSDRLPTLAVTPPRAYVFEPDGAAIRAGLVPDLGSEWRLTRLGPQIAYLTGDAPVSTPWLDGFRVLEVLPAQEKALRAWVRARDIGVLEIKKRGRELDPAALRRRLRLSGAHSATLILTPTPQGARALVVERVPADPDS